MDRLVILTSRLKNFMDEVPPRRFRRKTVRFMMTEKWADAVMPTKVLSLDLMGLNGSAIVWLHYESRVRMVGKDPFSDRDRDIVIAFDGLNMMAGEFLDEFYDVREGCYGIPHDIEAIRGWFECAELYRENEDKDGSLMVKVAPGFVTRMRERYYVVNRLAAAIKAALR